MIRLIKKDIRFSTKNIAITLIYIVILPILLMFDEDLSSINLLSFLITVVALGLIIGKICYIEDSDDIKMFLKSLPYKNKSLISSRFLELFILDIISISYVTIIQIILRSNYSIEKIIEMNIISGSCLLIYYSIYLFLYFKKNYNAAQNTVYILVAFVFITIFLSSKFSNNFISNYNFLNAYYITPLIACISILIFFISMYMLMKRKKHNYN